MNRKKNYPLYQTTVFEDFRIMTENVAKRYPDRYAFTYKKNPRDTEVVHVTYAQAREYIRALGTGEVELGMREEKVAIIGDSNYNWVMAYFSLMSIGAVTIPIDKDLPVQDIASILNTAECKYIFYSGSIDEKVKELLTLVPTITMLVAMTPTGIEGVKTMEEIAARGDELYKAGDNTYYDYKLDPDKLASIVFTSGTTGKGKGVMLTQTNIVSDMTQGMYNFAITDKTMCVLPPHHTFGSTVNLVGHYAQGCEICMSNGLKYILGELKEYQPTHLVLVPLFVETFHKRIWAEIEKQGKEKLVRRMMKISNALRRVGIDLRRKLFAQILANFGGKLQMIICGGAALNQDVIDDFDAFGITILNGYGITECSPLISCNRNEYQKTGSVGTPIIGEKVKILNPDENGEGEICVKGPNVMIGYYNDPEATAAAFDDEGYFRTGDYGRLDDEGWIYITGRLKNLIILSNGKNVYPEELETDIKGVYGVNEVVVYEGTLPTKAQTGIIVAEIYPDYEALEAHGITDVQKYFDDAIKKINARNVSYKQIAKVKIRTEDFPKNTSRKITRFKIDKSID